MSRYRCAPKKISLVNEVLVGLEWRGLIGQQLAPLTNVTKVDQRAFKKHWSSEQVQAFKAAKTMVAQDVLLAHPDPNEEFVIETDASDYQLGAAIKQKGNRKLTEPQKKHSAIEKELLATLMPNILQLNSMKPIPPQPTNVKE